MEWEWVSEKCILTITKITSKGGTREAIHDSNEEEIRLRQKSQQNATKEEKKNENETIWFD